MVYVAENQHKTCKNRTTIIKAGNIPAFITLEEHKWHIK